MLGLEADYWNPSNTGDRSDSEKISELYSNRQNGNTKAALLQKATSLVHMRAVWRLFI